MSRRGALLALALLGLVVFGPLACATAGGSEHRSSSGSPYHYDSIHYDTWPSTYQWRGSRPYYGRR